MIQSVSQNVQNLAEREYSQSPFYLHPLNTDTSLLGVYINAKFAINSHCSYKKNLAIKSLCIFYKPRI